MKTKLIIGSAIWVFDDAATPAKIADLLGKGTPVIRIYEAGHNPQFFFENRNHDRGVHDVSIHEVTDDVITKSFERVNALIAEHKKGKGES